MTTQSHLTIQTLENMFVYLGCANIPTQEAMDGAIPIESLLHSRNGTVSCLKPAEIGDMEPRWHAKAVWFSGEHLGLSTVENVHWSAISRCMTELMPYLKMQGLSARKSFTDRSDGFVKFYYSEIDRFGSFVKFPIKAKHLRTVVVRRLYNPSWLLEFTRGEMRCISSESDSVFKEKQLNFLAPFMCGVAQSLGAYWLVRTRFDAICPSLTLLTDPTGVKEFWKLREVPAGRSRRDALLHWVEKHWRQQRNDPDVEVFVRKHMRGATSLKQGQFTAEITPSVRDTLDAEKAREEREFMRKIGTDKRRRRRLLQSRR
jgi:hypothetical protein